MVLVVILCALAAFEIVRLKSDESVRLRQTWEFTTPTGPLIISDVLELRQGPAIPYLPGGETGRSETVGRMPVSFRVFDSTYYISSDPRSRIGNAVRAGLADPSFSMEGLRNEYTTGFIRRLRQARSKVVINLLEMSQFERAKFRIASKLDQTGGLQGSMTLSDFEALYPGFRLVRITYTVTDEPVD